MRHPASIVASLLLVATPLLGGCVADNETVVFVEPTVEQASVQVGGSALGVTVKGGFKLRLVLGPRASGPSQVKIGAFSIKDAGEKGDVVPALALTSATMFPVTVQPDGEVTVDFTFDTGASTLPVATKDALCAPAGVRIAGTIEDSLQQGATPVVGAVVQATGCM
jgi:hypothetical protein